MAGRTQTDTASEPASTAPATAAPKDPSELLRPKQVEAEYGFPEGTLAYWRNQGEGPRYVQPGRSVYYRRSALETFVAERTVSDHELATRRSRAAAMRGARAARRKKTPSTNGSSAA
jgi:predicted DNA-binding transcriptional regulator AlpA